MGSISVLSTLYSIPTHLCTIPQTSLTNIQQQLQLKSKYKKLPQGRNPGYLYISTVFRPVESVTLTVNSLIVNYVSRTRRHSLANCLDPTTDFLNPSVHGFSSISGSVHTGTGYTTDLTGSSTGHTGSFVLDDQICSDEECMSDDSMSEDENCGFPIV